MLKDNNVIMIKAYEFSKQSPNLVPSFVCYADILGYKHLSKEAIDAGNGEQFLSGLRNILTKVYERVRWNAKSVCKKEYFSVKVFTDNIVVGYPLNDYRNNFGEVELDHILHTFAEFQLGLSLEGFLIRGGISFGFHYMDDDIVFGDAFLDAYSHDRTGGSPRISLSTSAIEIIKDLLDSTNGGFTSPLCRQIIKDSDGNIFLNYLDQAFIAYPEGGVFFDVIDGHKKTIVDGLKKYRDRPSIWIKYEWAARYHNFICKEFVNTHPVFMNPDADEELAAAAEDAQLLMNYTIDIEDYAPVFARHNIKSAGISSIGL